MLLGNAHHPHRCVHGIALVSLLVALFVLGLATQRVAFVLSDRAERDREQSALMLGQLYALAIKSYYEASPGTVKQYPQRLDDLLEDKRYVYVKRHLRKPYKDPLTQDADFGLLLDDTGRIKGVFTAPVRTVTPLAPPVVEGVEITFSEAARSWQFVHARPSQASTTPASAIKHGGRS